MSQAEIWVTGGAILVSRNRIAVSLKLGLHRSEISAQMAERKMATSSKRVRGQDSMIEAKEEHPNSRVKREEEDQRRKCPYLDTINRQVLDFDMEKVSNSLILREFDTTTV